MARRKFAMMSTVLLVLIGCSNDASHVPNPVLLPVEAVRAGASNIVYGAKRAKVARFVRSNYDQIKRDALGQGGPTERAAMDLAGVPASEQFALHKRLQADPDLYFAGDPEPLIVALMVHAN